MGVKRRSGRRPRAELLLIQFTRSPQLGGVKTRMQPHLTAEQAYDLHCELTRWTCGQLVNSGVGDVELAVAGDRTHPLIKACKSMGVRRVVRQRGEDLGQRMYNAMRCGLARYRKVILVGSDCPAIDAEYLHSAALALHTSDVVLGPAADGGYVLIGARAISPALFHGIAWGGEQVFEHTVAALEHEDIRWQALPQQFDIDRPDDLPRWEALVAQHKTARPPDG